MTPTVIAVVSDLHCGSTVALCPPMIPLDDGGAYHATKAQRWLWERWRAYWKRVEQVRRAERAKLMVVVNGDLTDGGAHHGTTQIMSDNPTSQAAVVNAALHVPKQLSPDYWVFTRGTEIHVGKSACYEERVALGLKKDGENVLMDGETGSASHWLWKGEPEPGVTLDIAHHGRMGVRPWTRQNVVNALALEIATDHNERGKEPPAIAIRSHMHRFADTGMACRQTRLIQTPAWQLATAFIHRISPGALADVGGIILTIKDGKPSIEAVIYQPDDIPTWSPA